MDGFGVFNKYKVKVEGKGSAYIRTDWEGDSYYEDYDFVDEQIIEGGELMTIFADNLTDIDCIEFRIKDGKFYFSYFNPNNGSGCDKVYIIEDVED